MATQIDPLIAAIVDENDNNSFTLPLPEAANGFNDDQKLTAPKFNAVARSAGRFANWLDQNSPRIELAQGAVTCRLSSTSLRYATGAGLSQPVLTEGHYYIDGRLVQHTLARCTARGQSPKLFIANRTTHLWIKADGTMRFEDVALGDPSAGALAGEYYEGEITTDATDVTQHIGPGDDFFSGGFEFDNQRNLCDAVTKYRGDTLRVLKEIGSSAYLRFEEEQDTSNTETIADNGWHLESYNGSARNLRLVQRVFATNWTAIDFGDILLGTVIESSRAMKITSNEGTLGNYALEVVSTVLTGKGSYFKTSRTPAATFEADSTGGVPICIVPRAAGFVVAAPVGSMLIGVDANSDLEYKDNNSVTRYVHATALARMAPGNAYTTTLSAIAANTLGASVNYPIVNGARYRISMSFRTGRAAGSTRDCTIVSTIGGINLPWNGHVVGLFQAGAASQLEHTWTSGEYIYTATTTATVAVLITLGPVNGAGNINIAYRSVYIEGPLD
jgi:hypothetical protein